MQLDVVSHHQSFVTMLPNGKFDASTSMKKGLDWSACIKIGAEVNVFFKLSKALVALAFHVIWLVLLG